MSYFLHITLLNKIKTENDVTRVFIAIMSFLNSLNALSLNALFNSKSNMVVKCEVILHKTA